LIPQNFGQAVDPVGFKIELEKRAAAARYWVSIARRGVVCV
jgi:hypothetical protein